MRIELLNTVFLGVTAIATTAQLVAWWYYSRPIKFTLKDRLTPEQRKKIEETLKMRENPIKNVPHLEVTRRDD